VPDGVHASVPLVQPAAAHSNADLSTAEPERQQLPRSSHALLAAGEFG
jgi:hypothetical protein